MIESRNVGPLVGLMDAIRTVSLSEESVEGGRLGEVTTLQPLVHEKIGGLRGWTRVYLRGYGSSVPDGVYEHAQSGVVVCIEMKLLRPPWLLTSSEPSLTTKILGMVSVESGTILDDEGALLSMHQMALEGSRGIQPRRPCDYRTVRDWETILAATSAIMDSKETPMLLRPDNGRKRVLTYESSVGGMVENALGQALTYARNMGCERGWHLLAVVAVYVPVLGRTFWFMDYSPPRVI